ncbi:hypothetical protein [Zooshikella sp. RANM57]|uniref:hypothetical protein n=1 Tax=Zooshikella sp. RANM57 TaxID=3425863 RepID=UPI003D6FFF6D
MKWKKIGHVFKNSLLPNWAINSALTPTPILINSNTIRVYAGFRYSQGISRIGYVDVNANNPKEIIHISEKPSLDVGRNGCFDDNGVILGDVIKHNNKFRMYYVGFQKVEKAKFLAFTGLAESEDGKNFYRVSEAPVLDRYQGACTIRAIHTCFFENNVWKIWYAVGNDWEKINECDYPKYNIWYNESSDGISFKGEGKLCVDVQGNEYRIGRPSVIRLKDKYMMFYTKGSLNGNDYFPGVAFSCDGINWTRKDSALGLELSQSGFDSKHLCYPRLIDTGNKLYAFYNGNDMGKEGFGVAELIEC